MAAIALSENDDLENGSHYAFNHQPHINDTKENNASKEPLPNQLNQKSTKKNVLKYTLLSLTLTLLIAHTAKNIYTLCQSTISVEQQQTDVAALMNPKSQSSSQLNNLFMKGHFNPNYNRNQQQYEKSFWGIPDAETARNTSHQFTAHVHQAGSDGDYKDAIAVRDLWADYLGVKPIPDILESGSVQSALALTGHTLGRDFTQCTALDDPHKRKACIEQELNGSLYREGYFRADTPRAWTDTYYSYLTYADDRYLAYTPSDASEPSFIAKLEEDILEKDHTSKEGTKETPVFHGFSANGSATGNLVYAGYGLRSDFEALKARGIDFTDKIVIVKYGQLFRGLKVKFAQEAGAAAVLIYSDPADDGNITEENGYDAYPDGPARQPSSVQRGSAQFLSYYPGDPQTPFKPSYKNAHRIPLDSKHINIPRIPSLPLSYEDAIPLLKSLNGFGFSYKPGGLKHKGVTYDVGPSPGKVTLVNKVIEKVNPIWNSYALIPGHTDEVVILGNHNDAWTFGAADPNSGTASISEVVRGYGKLLKQGWKPLRTILFASWDAEEYGLIGSTEFGEDYSDWLLSHAVAYLNLDGSASGSELGLAASPTLSHLFKGTLSDLIENGYDILPKDSEIPQVSALGSGSDFTVFLQHLGLASSNFGYSRSSNDPVYHYHSIYDSAHWMDEFGDPSFKHHVAASQILGTVGLRLVDSFFVPINVTHYAYALQGYLDKVLKEAEEAGWKIGYTGFQIPLLQSAVDKVVDAAQQLDTEQEHLERELAHYSQLLGNNGWAPCANSKRTTLTLAARAALESQIARATHHANSINKRRIQFESKLISLDGLGLPSRPWYRNLVVAPGIELGYGAHTFPGVSEAITLDNSLVKANAELLRLVATLKHAAKSLA